MDSRWLDDNIRDITSSLNTLEKYIIKMDKRLLTIEKKLDKQISQNSDKQISQNSDKPIKTEIPPPNKDSV